MSDRELLEKAAKAAGIDLRGGVDMHGAYEENWDSLSNNSDALALAVALRINLDMQDCTCCVNAWTLEHEESFEERFEEVIFNGPNKLLMTPIEAARRAITKAAAAIGELK